MICRQALVLLALTLSSGCSSLVDTYGKRAPVEEIGTGAPAVVVPAQPPQPEAPVPRREPLPVPAPAPTAPSVLEPAPATPASTLLISVDQAIAANDLDRAAALCERALRIMPRDGKLWYKLATIRYMQGRYADAQGFAQRALSLAGADALLQRDINVLLEQVTAAL
jgi:tetratricopeptide (TPR) repeat protein